MIVPAMLAFCSVLILLYLKRLQSTSPVKILHQAIINDEFVPFYQPVVELATGKITGAEVLIRWQHPQQGIIPPNEFIHTAEKSGLIEAMTISLMSHIFRDMNSLNFYGDRPFHLGLNIAPASLAKFAFTEQCMTFVRRLRSINISVVLEITERQQNRIDEAILKKLKEENVALALDDFGTGYSNYAALQQMAPLLLKIDKMFIDGLGKGGTGDIIINNIVQLSGMVNIPLVAEGIEEEAQAEALRQLGVKFGQGYLFSKPLPFREFVRLIKKQMNIEDDISHSRIG